MAWKKYEKAAVDTTLEKPLAWGCVGNAQGDRKVEACHGFWSALDEIEELACDCL
jgi:hypothetical protein